MMDRAALAAAGVDVEEALGRVLGNETLLERLLGIYASDGSVAELGRALDAGDVTAARAAAHALKGVSANLSMGGLTGLATATLDRLHAGDLPAARELFEQVRTAHEDVLRAIAAGA